MHSWLAVINKRHQTIFFKRTNDQEKMMSDNQDNRERRLRAPEAIYKDLMKSKQDIVVTPEQALAIWKVFRREQLSVSHFDNISYRAFMQACLMSAREASSAMTWIEVMFRSAYKPNATVGGVLKALGKAAVKKYYARAVGKEQQIYAAVITSIANSHRPYFDMISQGMEI
jgi:hypothetical protein